MYCPQCSTSNFDTSIHCIRCGENLVSETVRYGQSQVNALLPKKKNEIQCHPLLASFAAFFGVIIFLHTWTNDPPLSTDYRSVAGEIELVRQTKNTVSIRLSNSENEFSYPKSFRSVSTVINALNNANDKKVTLYFVKKTKPMWIHGENWFTVYGIDIDDKPVVGINQSLDSEASVKPFAYLLALFFFVGGIGHLVWLIKFI